MSINYSPKVSVVIPCHNEAGGIMGCITDARTTCESFNISLEIIVVDNASNDNTAELARVYGAHVIEEPHLGYGNALRRGFREARGEFIVFGDGDGSYDFKEIPRFLSLIQEADFVTGERRFIASDAMPFLHRYVGRPLFAFIIRHLFGVPVHDSHSGFGMIKREVLIQLPLTSSGMEFASEILIIAHRNKVRIVSTPIHYRSRIGTSKLRTFRDGARHLHFMGKVLASP